MGIFPTTVTSPMVAVREWYDFARADLSPRSALEYRAYVSKFIFEHDPFEATPGDVSTFLSSIGGRGPARSLARQALRHLFGYLRVVDYRETDPTAVLPRERRRERRSPDWLTEEELCQVVYAATLHDVRWAWELVFIVTTGARIGEACAVTSADIRMDAALVTFRHTKNGHDRDVHLGSAARAAASWLLARNGTKTVIGVDPPGWRRRMKVLAHLTGLRASRLHPHTLRHTAGTLLSERGATQKECMDFLGHTDPGMTTHYQHVTSPRAKMTSDLFSRGRR